MDTIWVLWLECYNHIYRNKASGKEVLWGCGVAIFPAFLWSVANSAYSNICFL